MSKVSVRGLCAAVGGLLLASAPARAGVDRRMNPLDLAGTVQNEVSLTLNPALPNNVVSAYNDGIGTTAIQGLGVSYSTDGGATWTETSVGPPTSTPFGQLPDIFDPVTGADTQGNVYTGYIASAGGAGGPSGLFVHSSGTGGATWGPDTVISSSGPAVLPPQPQPQQDPGYRFNDKPHLAVDRGAASPNKDNVYAAFIQDSGFWPTPQPWSDILFSASGPGGGSWLPAPVKISDKPSGQPGLPGGGMANGPNVAVAPNGDVYVAWLETDVTIPGAKPGTLMLDIAPAASVGVGPTAGFPVGGDIAVRSVTTVPNDLHTATGATDARSRGFPVLGIAPTLNGQGKYDLYMVYTEVSPNAGTDEGDIFFLKSTDGGQTWPGPPRKINDDNTPADQFAPWLAVKPNGTIDVAWYDKRLSPDNDGDGLMDDNLWDVFFANSTDGGATFSANQRVTDQSFATPNTGGGPWIGEYLGLAVDGTDAFIGFTSGVGDPNNGDVYFDRIPNPDGGPGDNVVPEPATLGLLALALTGLAGYARRRRPRAML